MKRSRFYIYTDASTRDGISAWAFVSVTHGLAPRQFVYHTCQSGLIPAKVVKSQIEVAELYAALQALKWVIPFCKVNLFVDSEHVVTLLKQVRPPAAHTSEGTLYQELDALCRNKRIELAVHKIRRVSDVFAEYVNLLCRDRAAGAQILPFWLFELSYKHRHIDWAEQPAE